MKRAYVKAMLKRHEGLKLQTYKDTVGKISIGYGRCLEIEGIDESEAEFLLDNDINRCFAACRDQIASFGSLDDNRQAVLVDMCFNMGINNLLHFVKMLAAIEKRDFDAAANEMIDSRWASQVKHRATELASIMRNGG
jgi:lysozyme